MRPSPFIFRPNSAGFAYLTLLIVIAIIGIAASASLQVGSILQRRSAEEELLAIGLEFRSALIQYANATPGSLSRYPITLQDLVKDPRYQTPHRYLRKLYFDPLTGQQTWGTVMSLDGKGIIGIYSLSKLPPIKIANFDVPFRYFEGKISYADWVFMAATATPTLRLVKPPTSSH